MSYLQRASRAEAHLARLSPEPARWADVARRAAAQAATRTAAMSKGESRVQKWIDDVRNAAMETLVLAAALLLAVIVIPIVLAAVLFRR